MIRLTDEMQSAVNDALTEGVPITIAAVDAAGQPNITFRGSTQALDEERLALWARNPEGGLVRSIQSNPRVALLYRHPARGLALLFHGRAHVTEDAALAAAIYERIARAGAGPGPGARRRRGGDRARPRDPARGRDHGARPGGRSLPAAACRAGEWDRGPVSGILSRPPPEGGSGDGHPSRTAVARRLQQPTRGRDRTSRRPPMWPCSGWGLPGRPVSGNAGALLPHHFTLAAPPGPGAPQGGGMFLWHFPSARAARPLAGTLSGGVPTFLPRGRPPRGAVRRRPSGPLSSPIITRPGTRRAA